MICPELKTARLRLRAHKESDLLACAAMWRDERVTKNIGGRPFSTEETWQRMLRYAGLWSLVGYGYWLIEESAGQLVGEVGLADFKRDLSPMLEGPELGYALLPSMQGKGYASEAVAAALAFADARFPITSCFMDDGHDASRAVAIKAGYVERARTTYHGTPVVLFSRVRPALRK